ncbi:hypothetical protein NDU88_003630 [Pleurodeles waltl]|uniref:Uncharacterized protein n=1 Tax=Pleurodeles waltl TaxID=8319 RepID=A0AAV7VER2_PLEWA|nr:hypothetical protein NDU88_003630 [Pleurodeles waltl]
MSGGVASLPAIWPSLCEALPGINPAFLLLERLQRCSIDGRVLAGSGAPVFPRSRAGGGSTAARCMRLRGGLWPALGPWRRGRTPYVDAGWLPAESTEKELPPAVC